MRTARAARWFFLIQPIRSLFFWRRRCRCYRPCLSYLLNHVTYAGVDLVSPQRRSQDHLPFYPFEVGTWKILGTRLISHQLFDQFDVRVDKSVSCSSSLLSGVGFGWKTRGGHHVLTHSLREGGYHVNFGMKSREFVTIFFGEQTNLQIQIALISHQQSYSFLFGTDLVSIKSAIKNTTKN